jgi:hypothetical protein
MDDLYRKTEEKVRRLVGAIELELDSYYSSYEFQNACGLNVFRGTKRVNGTVVAIDIVRFDRDGNTFNPRNLDPSERRKWVQTLADFGKLAPSQIMMFLDIDLETLRRDLTNC